MTSTFASLIHNLRKLRKSQSFNLEFSHQAFEVFQRKFLLFLSENGVKIEIHEIYCITIIAIFFQIWVIDQ